MAPVLLQTIITENKRFPKIFISEHIHIEFGNEEYDSATRIYVKIAAKILQARKQIHLFTGITVLHIAITVRNRTTSGELPATALSSSTSVHQ